MKYPKFTIASVFLLLILMAGILAFIKNGSIGQLGKLRGLALLIGNSSTVVGTPFILWDGETASPVTNGAIISSDCYQGGACMESSISSDWKLTVNINLDNPPLGTIDASDLPAFKKGIVNYDAVRFYAKTDKTEKDFSFAIVGKGGATTNAIDINSYIEGGQLDTTWRLVTIPMSLFGNETVLSDIYSFNFITQSVDYKIYVDQIEAVNLSDPVSPSVAPIAPIALSGNIDTTTSSNFTVTNTGDADLIINNFSLSGTNASDFSVTGDNITIKPGQSQSIPINFMPTTVGSKSATLTINHNKTLAGYSSTLVDLSGQALESGLNLSANQLNFWSKID
ncbi:MAG: hypothetical protein UV64_C0016G0002 [Parcubacteria group bacterium GW2011_GWC1_43_11b]|nr:MAG: hypothetical protein UV64_C0016G0002 [Parcubacteria group bacterium GW2011_GWC1_43_11b]